LSTCINSLQSSIAELKNKSAAGVITVGFVDSNGTVSQQSGLIKVTAEKSAETGNYKISYIIQQAKKHIVLVVPKSEDLTNLVLTNSSELGFSVVARNKDGGVWTGFWFAVFSP